jgi:hypothetical protein
VSEALTSSEVTYSNDDFVAFARQIRQGRMRLYRRIAAVFAILMPLMLALDAALRQPLPWWQAALGIAAAAMLWTLASPRVQGRMIQREARRLGLASGQSFAVTDEGLEARAESGHTLTKWSAIREVRVAEGRLFAFVSDTSAYIVPRRIFGSDAEFEAFAAAAEQGWEKRHRL